VQGAAAEPVEPVALVARAAPVERAALVERAASAAGEALTERMRANASSYALMKTSSQRRSRNV
jgi:hypothetical protein